LYYEVDNRILGIRPGQRIGVELPWEGAREALVVPYSSIVLDIHGNAWVYVVSGVRQYRRQRVLVRWTEGPDAILEAGPRSGDHVVVAGAAELIGTEFGTGK
jgi:multidrug efflux pump subunit AcrA (membrane-fusion protein)